MLSEKAISEFQELYFKEFGKRLSLEEATEKATGLLRLYKAVMGEPNGRNHGREKDCGRVRL